MARLDKSRSRVICDDFGRCGTELAIVDDRREGRILFLEWGWKREADRVWRYNARRADRTPPEHVTGLRHAEGFWFAPLLGPLTPQLIACPARACSERPPQRLYAAELDVLPMHDIAGIAEIETH